MRGYVVKHPERRLYIRLDGPFEYPKWEETPTVMPLWKACAVAEYVNGEVVDA